jgi:hypothetical protein
MQELLIAARSRTSAWRYEHVGVLIWGFFMEAKNLYESLGSQLENQFFEYKKKIEE